MKKVTLPTLTLLCVAALFSGAVLAACSTSTVLPTPPTDGATPATAGAHSNSVARWVSQAATVPEVASEANLVVRARVVEAPKTRVLRFDSPMIEIQGDQSTVVGSRTTEALFSDTLFEVDKVYAGEASSGETPLRILVMQTGGARPDNPTSTEGPVDDPLYKLGEEHILFLVRIAPDDVQAQGRILYRTVNPAGRYTINGDQVSTYAERAAEARLPTTLADLEAQIGQAATTVQRTP